MRCPARPPAPAAAPGRSAPPPSDGLARFVRRVVLIAAAVGAGFLVAALFDGPAVASAADRTGSGEHHQHIRVALDSSGSLARQERPARRDHPAGGGAARPVTLLRAVVGGLAAAPDRTHPARTPSSGDASSVVAPRTRTPLSFGVDGGRPADRPAERRADRRQNSAGGLGRRAADRQGPRVPARSPTPLAGPSVARPAVVALVVAPLPHVVRAVDTVPIPSLVATLIRAAGAVLSPVLGLVSGPAVPPSPGPTAPPPAPAAESGSGRATGPTARPLTASESPRGPRPAPALARAAPTMAKPPSASVVGPVGPAAPIGRGAVRPCPESASSGQPGRPVPPADKAAAGVQDGPGPGPGLLRAPGWPSRCRPGQFQDPVPVLVEGRSPSAVARPG